MQGSRAQPGKTRIRVRTVLQPRGDRGGVRPPPGRQQQPHQLDRIRMGDRTAGVHVPGREDVEQVWIDRAAVQADSEPRAEAPGGRAATSAVKQRSVPPGGLQRGGGAGRQRDVTEDVAGDVVKVAGNSSSPISSDMSRTASASARASASCPADSRARHRSMDQTRMFLETFSASRVPALMIACASSSRSSEISNSDLHASGCHSPRSSASCWRLAASPARLMAPRQSPCAKASRARGTNVTILAAGSPCSPPPRSRPRRARPPRPPRR